MNSSKEIDKIIANALASLTLEGMHPSGKGVSITRQYLEGKIRSKEGRRSEYK